MDITKYKRSDLDAAQAAAYARVCKDLRMASKTMREWRDRTGNAGIKDAYDACAELVDSITRSYEPSP